MPRTPVVTTAKDIAARLDVSVSTVGRALAGDPRISVETRHRVSQLADELGYVGNQAARMMRGVGSTVVGFVVPDVRNSFFSTAAHALTETLGERGHQLMLCETNDDRASELRQVRDLVGARVAGIVIVPSARPAPETVRLLRTLPHVQFSRRSDALAPHWFGADDQGAVTRATARLVELGHRQLAYVGGGVDVPTGAARLAGFRAALEAAGLPEESGTAVLGPSSSTQGGGSAHGRAALAELMASPTSPTAVVAGSVQVTRGLLTAVAEHRLDVPGDLSLIGFGDELGFSWWGPGLTTVAVPSHEMAAACGAWLLRRIGSAEMAAQPYHSVSSCTLLERGSTARPRTGRSPATRRET